MNKIWVVECQFKGSNWGVCSFVRDRKQIYLSYADTNFYTAHEKKRLLIRELRLNGARHWH